ncbi:hypothetical protein GKR72_14515 [Providencia stuartii]|uniref:Uncharacterized protein n=2 Tax=Providencia stuartii TaxID=588 RepID=A0AA86YIH5_PROST|nr:hypothetical protein [Providencia stuartii]AFH95570.1 hypothetical protein S70_18855 [Providencia stuartii MRSN 2154]GHB89817.1 hypothetical protein GCM10007290_14790 [Providencia thailandensis]AIN64135.1 putative membrane protein [Providencia stuartii]AMG66314.1 hypothetical protein AL507_06795 [Providencia stuartii]EDU58960.1 hypothetical protein PROSTU_02144 [Providencia stuartii ATCC 25827]
MALVPIVLGITTLILGPVLLLIIWLSFKGISSKPINKNDNKSSIAIDLLNMFRVLVGLSAIFLLIFIIFFLITSLNY